MTNSPKIYFISKEGKFYNSRDKYWYSKITNANYERSRKILDELVKIPRFEGCEVYETTEEHFMNEMASDMSNLVIAGEYFNNLLEKHACKIPTISQVNKTMYQKSKMTLETLKPFTKMHKEFLEAKEDLTDDVSGYYAEFIRRMAGTEIYQMKEIIGVLEAYQKNRSSILGITKKVLNN